MPLLQENGNYALAENGLRALREGDPHVQRLLLENGDYALQENGLVALTEFNEESVTTALAKVRVSGAWVTSTATKTRVSGAWVVSDIKV